jgi:probable rRNA maturation factor
MMSYRIHFRGRGSRRPETAEIRKAVLAALAHEGVAPGELAIVLVDEEQMRELSRAYRKKDASTDVLAFPDGTPDPDSGLLYFGDVAIALPVAEVQAAKAGHTLKAEMSLLAVHGVLHLLGYDHAIPGDRKRMWATQTEILQSVGAKIRSA